MFRLPPADVAGAVLCASARLLRWFRSERLEGALLAIICHGYQVAYSDTIRSRRIAGPRNETDSRDGYNDATLLEIEESRIMTYAACIVLSSRCCLHRPVSVRPVHRSACTEATRNGHIQWHQSL